MINEEHKKLVEELSTQYEFEEDIKTQVMKLNQLQKVVLSNVDMMSITALALLKSIAKETLNPNVMKLERLLEYELLQIPEEDAEVFNGKIVCVESVDSYFTCGKIYEVKAGVLEDNYGNCYGVLEDNYSNCYGDMNLFQNLQEINDSMIGVEFIKLVE